jgi:ATP-binding cassette subfamily F protein uup
MALIHLDNAFLNIGPQVLLDRADFVLEKNERVALIGRNGSGKSSLMKVLCGEMVLDDGRLIVQNDLRIAYMQQDPPADDLRDVFTVVSEGLGPLAQLIADYAHVLSAIEAHPLDAHLLEQLQRLQAEIDNQQAWDVHQRIERVLSRLALKGDTQMQALSGGWRRRVALARALVSEPDVLLLDEPTNHLDMETVRWMQEMLLSFKGSLIFITHDRAFLRALATRILDLDRGQLFSYPGNYEQYLNAKAERLEIQALQQAKFDKKLAQEEVWVRQGIKARRTRNEGRVRALQDLRKERRARIDVQGGVKVQAEVSKPSGKRVVECRHVCYQWEDTPILNDFNFTLMRGDRVAIVGPNGCGKSTLLSIILGQLAPQSGSVRQGTQLQVAYFDQLRSQLDWNKTVVEVVGDGHDYVEINGQSRHIYSYLEDFLFSAERARSQIAKLSGGERNRVLLAKIFAKPSNLLVMDEPTNDLDIETMEVLEALLAEYPGSLLLTSHDRDFINNTVTSLLVFEGDGRLQEYVGDYDDWSARRAQVLNSPQEMLKPVPSPKSLLNESTGPQNSALKTQNKLSYKQQRALEQMPAQIEALENEQAQLALQVSGEDFYQQDSETVQGVLDRLAQIDAEIESKLIEWADLEEMQAGLKG